jgi:hypothetical protein
LPVRQRAGEGGFRTVGPPVREKRFSRLPPSLSPAHSDPVAALTGGEMDQLVEAPPKVRFAPDSPLEGRVQGFEPSVPASIADNAYTRPDLARHNERASCRPLNTSGFAFFPPPGALHGAVRTLRGFDPPHRALPMLFLSAIRLTLSQPKTHKRGARYPRASPYPWSFPRISPQLRSTLAKPPPNCRACTGVVYRDASAHPEDVESGYRIRPRRQCAPPLTNGPGRLRGETRPTIIATRCKSTFAPSWEGPRGFDSSALPAANPVQTVHFTPSA